MASLKSIYIKNYKAFQKEQLLEVRPVTVLIGKNSSGKSSIMKLLPLFQKATSEIMTAPLMLSNNGVALGRRYEELFYNYSLMDLSLGLNFDNGNSFKVTYAINNGQLFVYNYEVTSKGNKFQEQVSPEGFPILKGLKFPKATEMLTISAESLSLNADYIGPIRISAPKEISFEGNNDIASVGLKGENAYSALLNSYLSDGKLFEEVSKWFEKNLEGQKLSFKQNGPSTGSYSLYVRHEDIDVNISQVGQGLSQVLPIIVASFLNNNVDILGIEQPALHLHPAAHANVAYRIAESAKLLNKKYLIESHSENFILGLRNLVANHDVDFSSDDVIIYYVNRDDTGAVLDKIEILPNGELTTWPVGIFSESFDLMSEIMEHNL